MVLSLCQRPAPASSSTCSQESVAGNVSGAGKVSITAWRNLPSLGCPSLQKQRRTHLESIRQDPDVCLRQLPLAIEDQRRKPAVAEQVAQVRCLHARLFH